MSKQGQVVLINTTIGLLIGMPLFLLFAMFIPILIMIPLLDAFAGFKLIEVRLKVNSSPSRKLDACILWLIMMITLTYILSRDVFLHGNMNMVIAGICIVSGVIPFLISRTKDDDKRGRYLNILYPCIIWSIIILVLYQLDIVLIEFLSNGMTMMFIIFPVAIFTLNLIYESILLMRRKVR